MYRIERDSMGEIKVPEVALWGAQTQRSLENFHIGSEKMPLSVIEALIYTIRNEKKLKDKYKYESILDFYNESVFVANDNKLTQEEFYKLVDWLKRNDIIRSENNGSN